MNCTCFSKCKDGQSLHSRLFMDLQERIKSACPDIQWCDQWWGQEQFSYRPAVAFPAVLIDMPNTSLYVITSKIVKGESRGKRKRSFQRWLCRAASYLM